jgi:hypothetical protein
MDRRFINRDFEQFVKQNADQYRMFPSEKVWEGIHNTLHTRRRWYGFGLALLLLSTATVTTVMLNSPGKKQKLADKAPVTVTQKENKSTANNNQPVLIAVTKPVSDKNASEQRTSTYPVNLFGNPITSVSDKPALNEAPAVSTEPAEMTNENHLQLASVTSRPPTVQKNIVIDQKVIIDGKRPVTKQALNVVFLNPETITIPTDENKPVPQKIIAENELTETKNNAPYTIESVVNAYNHKKERKKLSWQIYFSPTISYRKLTENKAFLEAARTTFNLPSNYSYSFTDINNIVTHKPDMGLQLGFGTGYPVSKRLRITAGLQLNVSKYDIQAYSHDGEVATIALSNNAGGTNTVSTITNYRNIGGYKAKWLHNMYVSGSLPVGLELKLNNAKKASVGIAASIQPSYVLGNRAYLLSADYKNYAEIPSLTRKWNLNTGFEIFASYSTGKLDWRIGPQVRYQVFSSFVDKYPINEHLFDFGLKLGLMLK